MNYNFENIQLKKNMYYNPKKSFSQILEELDPSENYANSRLNVLDAYQRQLKRFDIKTNGEYSNSINKFFESSASAVLFPEFLSRCIKKGMDSNSILNEIVANKTKVDSINFQNVQLENIEPKLTDAIDEAAEMPETKLKINKEISKLKKRGQMLTASYESLDQPINSFALTLEQLGHDLSDAIVKDAIDVLINGDNKKNAAEVLTTNKQGEIEFTDLINVWLKFQRFDLTTIIINPILMAKIANMEEFKNPNSKINFQNQGELIPVFGSKIIKTCAAPKDTIVFLDKSKALSQLIAKDITVEADKLIDRQITRSVIYTITGFTKIFKDASCVLKLKS